MTKFHKVSLIAFAIGAGGVAHADILIQNSTNAAGNAAAETDWLADIGISAAEVAHFVDFETGFTLGQNVSGVQGLFPGGMVIIDTSPAGLATIQTSSSFFGGSNPVGSFAIAHNEQQWLELDFSAQPVDYVALNDIDQAGMLIVVHFADGTSTQFTIETTAASGNSAEFLGIYRNDRPPITRLQFDASGSPGWGIDNIQYGFGLGSSYCMANPNSTGSAAVMSASGSLIASNNRVQLAAWNLPPNQFGFFITSLSQAFVPMAGGAQGNLCLGGAIGRYNGTGSILNSGPNASFGLPIDLTNTPTPTLFVSVLAGQTWNFQAWYRDNNPGPTSNFTDGVSVTFN